MMESIFEMAKSREGCDLFVKHKIDILYAIDMENPKIHPAFIELRYRKACFQIDSLRQKREVHLKRFSGFNPSKNDEISLDTSHYFTNKNHHSKKSDHDDDPEP